jgi:hypothetical protein
LWLVLLARRRDDFASIIYIMHVAQSV